jgi:RNA polymerase sigma-70 factor, ECF subfamily
MSVDSKALFSAQRERLWGLAYRMTGSVEDAEDVVQDAFAKLLEATPTRKESDLAFWLVRVVTNLSIDALRRRKRRAYLGPWLPAPARLPSSVAFDEPVCDELDPEMRYSQRESATFAFLIALEVLGPRQRAAFLLREVVGVSADQAATILGTSSVNVRVMHSRARRLMDAYDRTRMVPTPQQIQRHRVALEGFFTALASGDVRAVEAWLAEDANTLTDSAGEFSALARPLFGREQVARFYVRATANRKASQPNIELGELNGLPVAVVTLARPQRRQAPLSVVAVELDGAGRIRRVVTVLASGKLRGLERGPRASRPSSVSLGRRSQPVRTSRKRPSPTA